MSSSRGAPQGRAASGDRGGTQPGHRAPGTVALLFAGGIAAFLLWTFWRVSRASAGTAAPISMSSPYVWAAAAVMVGCWGTALVLTLRRRRRR